MYSSLRSLSGFQTAAVYRQTGSTVFPPLPQIAGTVRNTKNLKELKCPVKDFFSEADVKMVPECSVAIEKACQMEQVPMHQHEFTEIAFVARGTAIHHHVTTDGTHHTDSLIQGDVFSIQKGERHGYDACGTMVLYNISLRQDFLEQFRHLDVLPGWNWFFGNRTGTPRVVVHVPVGQRIRGMENLDRAVAEFRMRPLAYEIMTTSLVVDFLISVMRSAQFLRPSEEEEMVERLQYEQ